MRKSILAMVCFAGLALLASCKKDIQPTISIATEPGYVHQNSEVYSGDEISVGFNLTGENLTQVVISADQNGTVLYTYTEAIDNQDTYFIAKTFSIDATGTVLIGGTVTDAKGHTATISFNIICNEKPNAKFVGLYEGDALISGTFNVVPTGMDPIQQDVENEPIPAHLTILAGDNVNEVIAYVTINDEENIVVGTVEGNQVVFEAINTPFTMNYDYNGMTIPITLDMTYNITGTLNEGILELEGSCKGNGDFNLFIVSGTIEMDGTVGGSLTKTE